MLSKRQSNILKFIYEHTSQKGFVPTMREIGQATQISSTSVVNYNLKRLVQLGYVVKPYGKSRALALTKRGINFVEVHHVKYNLQPIRDQNQSTSHIDKLKEENHQLMLENERLRREHKNQVAALRREILYLSRELRAAQRKTELHPV